MHFSHYEPIASSCSKLMAELFSLRNDPFLQENLAFYIACAMYQSQLDSSAVLSAMTLLARYTVCRPINVPLYASDLYSLFITSYMLASKILYDKPIRLTFWEVVGRCRYSCQHLVRMERDFCTVVNWDLRIDLVNYRSFQVLVDHDLKQRRRRPPPLEHGHYHRVPRASRGPKRQWLRLYSSAPKSSSSESGLDQNQSSAKQRSRFHPNGFDVDDHDSMPPPLHDYKSTWKDVVFGFFRAPTTAV
ncbi:hypothetical protein K443DRAFT_130689 [Laccaria amethystina LaAM-08-1]|jgi:hypothetical protein|uniref:Cyclin N-terminal domain-containing protein n=1 Tax=Laccaria amethystina LaAM-08-1 TaxID=1095629 RepID=A0A0C9WY39_9AGAR|nr:hypothetical protein K443DRAFT_130689 [Laccaria amethystina LaAM-08-1]